MAAAFNITDEFIRSAKPVPGRQIEFPDAKAPGLALRISAKGKKSWTFRFRTKEGRQRRLSLGTYPAIPLVKARQMANAALGDTFDGKDPAKEKRAEKARANLRKIRTMKDLADSYFAAARAGLHRRNARRKRESTLEMEESYYTRLIKPKFGDLDIGEVLRPDFQQFLDDMSSKSVSAARQCRNIVRQMFNYAIRRELTDKNPAQFGDVTKSKSRERVLTDDELRAVWRLCDNPTAAEDVDLSKTMALALQLAMVTLQRGGEICGATLAEFDLNTETWIIPGERTKNHRAHVVPLSKLAVDIVKQAVALPYHQQGEKAPNSGDRPLFSARKGLPVTRHALTRAMKRITKHLKIKDATPHDFRRTGSTHMTGEALGIPRFHVSCVLNHISDTGGAAAVTAVYDRNAYVQEKRRALNKWASRLSEIVGDVKPAANVVVMKGGAHA